MKKFLLPTLAGYKLPWLRADFMAALVVAAIAIPQSLGYAVIVGLPVQTGLYCALLAPIVFAFFASSRRLVVGADSATAVLVAAGAGAVAVAGTSEYAGAVAVLGLLTGLILVIMAAARLGFLADLISQPVLTGFLAGVGVHLVISNLPEMFGVHASGSVFEKLGYLFSHLHEASLPTAAVSLTVLAVILVGARFRKPGALIAILGSIVAAKLLGLEAWGVKMIGEVPAGLPPISFPAITPELVGSLAVPAASIAIVVLTQSLAIIRSSAARYDEKAEPNKDLFSLGLANAAAGISSGFAINGSPPRTSANEMAGGRTQMVNVFMAVLIAGILLFATGLFAYVPAACLAAIVCSIGLYLIKIRELRDILTVRRGEFGVALIALLGVAILGVQNGIILAVALAVVERLRRQYRPHDEILLRDQQYAKWANDRLGVDKKQLDAPAGLLVYRFNDALFFENAGYFLARATKAVSGAKKPVKYFVLDAGAISDIDYTAAKTLKQLIAKLDADDIQLAVAHVTPQFRALLKRYALIDLIGSQHVYSSVRTAIEKYIRAHTSNLDRIHELGLPKNDYIVISGTALELMGIRETNDVDLVVSKKVYAELRAKKWKEYVQDDGKKVLSRHGYKIMTRWMGYDLAHLKKDQQMIEDVPVIGVRDLIECKKRMGREKDLEDIKKLERAAKKREEKTAATR